MTKSKDSKTDGERTVDSAAGLPDDADRTAPLSGPGAQPRPATPAPGRPAADSAPPDQTISNDGEAPTLATPRPGASRPSRAAATTFQAGDQIAERYRIVRFIARGGMGEVYEAADLVLKENVALKTILPEVAEDEIVVERFKREIQLARRVSHPNVCRIFDIGQHEPRDPAYDPVLFLTMELIGGETLSDRIRRDGPMNPEASKEIVRQMVSALAAAHDAGIIHRDFKSSNVMLVPTEDGGERVVVTDFGLARGTGSADPSITALSATGHVVGTPAYMAPEQVEGREITPAADIYAVGVVVYEMLTGRWPFTGETPFSIAAKRLTEAPEPIRVHAPELDPWWERLVQRCLERQPTDRFASAREMVAVFESGVVAPSISLIRKRRRRLTTLAAIAAGLVVVAAVIGIVLIGRDAPPPTTAPAPVEPASAVVEARRSVAVLGFRNLSSRPDDAWLSTALAEMVSAELAVGRGVRTIAGENVSRARADLGLEPSDDYAADTLEKIRGRLGADLVVSGSFLAQPTGDDLRIVLNARLQDTSGGEPRTLRANGSAADLTGLVGEVGAKLREELGLPALSGNELAAVGSTLPDDTEAARLYAEGIEKLRSGDALGARERLTRAVDLASDHAPATAALARAWLQLGYSEKAREMAALASQRASGLPREKKLAIEALDHQLRGDWDKVVEIYQGLHTFYPDNLDHGLKLAEAKTKAGRASEALETVGELRRLPGPQATDTRLDLIEAGAVIALGDYERLEAVAERAVTGAEQMGARELLGQALNLRGEARSRRGNPDGAAADYARSRELAENEGLRALEATALNLQAILAWTRGDLAGAGEAFRAARTIFEEIGNRRGMGSALVNLAILSRAQSELGRARDSYEEAIVIFEEIGERGLRARTLNNLGNVLADEGQLDDAVARYREALDAFEADGNRSGQSEALANVAAIERQRGELVRARRSYEDAVDLAREAGDSSGEAYALTNLGSVLIDLDELAEARRRLGEARVLAEELGESATLSDVRQLLATVEFEEGQFAEAERLAGEAAAAHAEEGWIEGEALARLIQVRALAGAGDRTKALEILTQVDGLTALAGGGEPSLWAALARAELARDEFTAARGQVDEVARQALEAELASVALEARRVAAELLAKAGDLEAARGEFEQLETEARRRDYRLLARRAREAREAL